MTILSKTRKTVRLALTTYFVLIFFNAYTQPFQKYSEDIWETQYSFFKKNKKKISNSDLFFTISSIGKKFRKDVFCKIAKEDSSFFNRSSSSVNLMESYDLAHGNMYGIIWQNKEKYFYILDIDFGLSFISNKEKDWLQIFDSKMIAEFENRNHNSLKIGNCTSENGRADFILGTKLKQEKSNIIVKILPFCNLHASTGASVPEDHL